MENGSIPVLMYKYTGARKYLDAVVNGYRKLDRDQMLFGGVPSSSEFLRTNTALDAMEACNATNYPLGLASLLQATGDVAYADKIEKATFNFLPGVMTSVGRTHQTITITERTDYPFSDRIDFTIRTDEPVRFDFGLRIPGWCKRARVLINGEPISGRVAMGEYTEVSRTFKNDDTVTLILPMEVQLSRWPRGGIGIERGPLAYALRIEEDWHERPKILGMLDARTQDHFGVNGPTVTATVSFTPANKTP